MAHKQMLFHAAAREKVLRGATQLADAVRVTLGPKSVLTGGQVISEDLGVSRPGGGGWRRGRRAHRLGDFEAGAGSAGAADRRELRSGRGVVVARMREGEGAFGYDAATNRYVDLVEGGIIDPVKGVRIALENAVSVASVLLLNEATMTDIPEPRREPSSEPELG